MKKIVNPVDPELVASELTKEKFVRETNNGNKEIYIITAHDSPNVMHEIGRLREVSFRDAGGGTGKEIDIDKFDTMDEPYRQLLVWNPEEKEIIGGYRFIQGNKIKFNDDGTPNSATSRLFNFSDNFNKKYLPKMIELGRSFVQPIYQPSFNIHKGIYSLDNLWDGLGSLIIDNPDMDYFFGKITMYPRFKILARDLILYFLHKYFPDKDELLRPVDPLELVTDPKELEMTLNGGSYEADYKILMKNIRILGETIPPLVNAYMNLSPTMKTFGTAVNPYFGDVEETAIMVTIKDIYDIKKARHISHYKKKG